jgi:serine/threonine-protein kinase ULK4
MSGAGGGGAAASMSDYQLYELLAQGARSAAYKARRKRGLDFVCVKRTPRAQAAGVAAEVAHLAALGRHANVVQLRAWYATPRSLYRVLELCSGGDLASLVAQDGGLPEAAVRLFGLDLAAGLLHCHARGLLLCGGLAPRGVLLDENGSLKISDLGAAQPSGDPARPPRVQPARCELARTAPELLGGTAWDWGGLGRGAGRESGGSGHGGGHGSGGGGGKGSDEDDTADVNADAAPLHTRASDLWSLGVLLYELASGRGPFSAGPDGDNSPRAVARRILRADPPPATVPVLAPRGSAYATLAEEEEDGEGEDDGKRGGGGGGSGGVRQAGVAARCCFSVALRGRFGEP